MALSQSALSELHEVFRSGEGTDFIRECVRVAMQELIDAEATNKLVGETGFARATGARDPEHGHDAPGCSGADRVLRAA